MQKSDLTSFFQIWQRAVDRQASFDELKQLALGGGGRFENVPILKIGNETLYGNDLNYYFLFYHFNNYYIDAKLSETILDDITNRIMTDSSLLQEAEKAGLIKIDTTFFNNQFKDYTIRNQKITLATQALSDTFVEKISGEAITIWFNNDVVPVSTQSGKLLAKTKMDNLYKQLLSGAITMVQAGEMIKNDPEIGLKIDPAYLNNAYYVFEDRDKESQPFIFNDMNQVAWSLGESDMSQVITSHSDDSSKENLFAIIKITKRSGSNKATSTEQLLETITKDAPKQNLGI